jgi:hypothetical protein
VNELTLGDSITLGYAADLPYGKKLDLLESNHGYGLKGLCRESIPKRK